MLTAKDHEILEMLDNERLRERGFSLLVSTYSTALYRHIYRMVSGHDDTDDVLQNVYMKVWNHIGTFKGESSLYSWLYRIATNEAITFINKRKKRSTESLDNENPHSAGAATSRSMTGDAHTIDAVQLIAELEKIISELPEKQQLVFRLRYYEEMAYEEMSSQLGTSVGALKASYHHAAKKVESALMNRQH